MLWPLLFPKGQYWSDWWHWFAIQSWLAVSHWSDRRIGSMILMAAGKAICNFTDYLRQPLQSARSVKGNACDTSLMKATPRVLRRFAVRGSCDYNQIWPPRASCDATENLTSDLTASTSVDLNHQRACLCNPLLRSLLALDDERWKKKRKMPINLYTSIKSLTPSERGGWWLHSIHYGWGPLVFFPSAALMKRDFLCFTCELGSAKASETEHSNDWNPPVGWKERRSTDMSISSFLRFKPWGDNLQSLTYLYQEAW